MKLRFLPPAQYVLMRAKVLAAPALFFVVTTIVSVELYRNAASTMDDMRPFLPLLVFNVTLIGIVVLTYVYQQVRSEYWLVRDFFEGERTGYVRRTADALRTPLTGVRWLAETLKDTDLTADQRDSVEKIHAASVRLIAQAEELLKVSKICGGLIHYRPTTSDLAATVRDAVDAVRPFAQSKDQTLDAAIPANAATFAFDAKLVRHVLEVLLMNAVQLAPEHGAVSATVRMEPDRALVDVSSSPIVGPTAGRAHPARRIGTAPGLDKAQREEYSDDVSMAVSYEIINAAHGELWVAQSENSITYTVALPLSTSPISSPTV